MIRWQSVTRLFSRRIRPGNGNDSVAIFAKTNVDDLVILCPVMAITALYLKVLGAECTLYLDLGTDCISIGIWSTFKFELEPVASLGESIFEESYLSTLIAIGGVSGIASVPGMSNHKVNVAVTVKIRGHNTVATMLIDTDVGVEADKPWHAWLGLVVKEIPTVVVVRAPEIEIFFSIVVKIKPRGSDDPLVPARAIVLDSQSRVVIAGSDEAN